MEYKKIVMKEKHRFEIRKISFWDIFPIWNNYLWPNRDSDIESFSTIIYNTFPYEFDFKCADNKITFLGAFVGNRLVGVNSGHLVGDNTYRSRGLYVFNEFRNIGIGVDLLLATTQCAIMEQAKFCWSMPRKSSINTYLTANFTPVGEWFITETSELNIFVRTKEFTYDLST